MFTYGLKIAYNPEIKKERIEHEYLLFEGNYLLNYTQGEVTLYSDDHRPQALNSHLIGTFLPYPLLRQELIIQN